MLQFWRKATVTLVFKKDRKEDLGKHRPANFISGKMTEKIILAVIYE